MIEMQNVQFRYSRKKTIFSDLSLSIPPGSITGLLGKNGAGKSTLLKLMTGIVFPQQGESLVIGQPAKRRHPDILSRIFFLPEEFILPPIPIKRYVQLNAPFYPHFDYEWLHAQLQEFSLKESDRLDKLSFGQRKKALIAFGIATRTDLLILDEPTNGLDIPAKSQFRKMIAASMTENRSIVISTHQVKDIEMMLDHLIVLQEGEVIFTHSMEEVSNALTFTQSSNGSETAFYAENGVHGVAAIEKNRTGTDTHVNLELLFNAISACPEKVETCFKEVR